MYSDFVEMFSCVYLNEVVLTHFNWLLDWISSWINPCLRSESDSMVFIMSRTSAADLRSNRTNSTNTQTSTFRFIITVLINHFINPNQHYLRGSCSRLDLQSSRAWTRDVAITCWRHPTPSVPAAKGWKHIRITSHKPKVHGCPNPHIPATWNCPWVHKNTYVLSLDCNAAVKAFLSMLTGLSITYEPWASVLYLHQLKPSVSLTADGHTGGQVTIPDRYNRKHLHMMEIKLTWSILAWCPMRKQMHLSKD